MKHSLPPDDLGEWYCVYIGSDTFPKDLNNVPEIEEWLSKFIEGEFYIRRRNLSMFSQPVTYTNKVFFKSQEDAALFALRWT